jgi:hypothetical protein
MISATAYRKTEDQKANSDTSCDLSDVSVCPPSSLLNIFSLSAFIFAMLYMQGDNISRVLFFRVSHIYGSQVAYRKLGEAFGARIRNEWRSRQIREATARCLTGRALYRQRGVYRLLKL